MSPTPQPDGPLLAIVPNVGMAVEGRRAFMDIKAVEGLQLYAALWPGRVLCLSREADPRAIGYGRWYDRGTLPFAVETIPANARGRALARHVGDAAVILGGADSHCDLDFVDHLGRAPVVYVIEYTLKTRLDMLRLSRPGLLRTLRTGAWLLRKEPARRRAMRRAAGLQANGTPAFASYAPLNPDPLLYFDTRLKTELFIGVEAAAAKADAVTAGGPLRLAFSGRLERVKGVDHLVPVMAALRAAGVTNATLDIYGQGSRREAIVRAAAAAGLADAVRVHGPVPFETELVPALKDNTDLFLCCHPQGDPSCTYLETMGCGVPIAGFLNEAFAGVLALGDCGVGVEVGETAGLATAIAALDRDRDRLAALTRGAAEVASRHLFETVFRQRVDHLKRIAFGGLAPA